MSSRLATIVRAFLVTALLAASSVAAKGQEKAVDLELLLALDVSGSVSPTEFTLQRDGLAQAFRDPAIHEAIGNAGHLGIAVALLFWAGPREQSLVVDWSHVTDPTTSLAFAGKIQGTKRTFTGVTAIGEALQSAAAATATNTYLGERIVIDVSGDGPTNFGRETSPIRDRVVATGVTVNGLAIVGEVADLKAYYRDHVIGGPGAFVTSASDFHDFVQAIRSKLFQEIMGRPSS